MLHACVALASSLVADKDAASTAPLLANPVLLLHAALLLTPTVPLELQVRRAVTCTRFCTSAHGQSNGTGLSTSLTATPLA